MPRVRNENNLLDGWTWTMRNTIQPNLNDATTRILLVGPIGAGKTTQLATLSGKKCGYLFDASAIEALAVAGVKGEFIEMQPQGTDIMISSIRKKGIKKGDKADGSEGTIQGSDAYNPTLYLDFVRDFDERTEAGWFDQFDWLLFDSCTTFGKALLERIIYFQEMVDRDDGRTDYQKAGTYMSNVIRRLASLPCNILVTAHYESRQDEINRRITNQFMMPGASRKYVPLLFGHVLICSHEAKSGTSKYLVQTKPDRENLDVRTTLLGLDMHQDVTIKDMKTPEKYGLGALLAKRG